VTEIAGLNPIEQILSEMQPFDEARRGHSAQGAEHREQDEHDQRIRIDSHGLQRRHMKGRRVAKEPAAYESRSSRRNGDREKRFDAHLRHHQLDGKHHAAYGCIESGSNPRPCARSDQGNALARGHANDLS
jgi:hypothetical protein